MSIDTIAAALKLRVHEAREFDRIGRLAQAQAAWESVALMAPQHAEAATRLARLAMAGGDAQRALRLLAPAILTDLSHATLSIDLAFAHLSLQQPIQAMAALEAAVRCNPDHAEAWLLLGEVREVEGDPVGALKAWYQAITRAQRVGLWHGPKTTPAHQLDAVMHAIEVVREGRRALFLASFADVRERFGASELHRVDRALTGYLGDWDAMPANPQQRPKFLYFPGLPDTPFLDPDLQPWAGRLRDAYPVIREEAQRTLAEDQTAFSDFVQLSGQAQMADYVGGSGTAPAWEAYFFYRRGKRLDDNHRRCPRTSELLESLDLCRISNQTPEICFSLLKAGSHIRPHFGVSNTRVVMHLPLVVPADCALHLPCIGEHRWREGELLMFDDTFQHEAWNRSAEHRLILLMDCWNPHLHLPERLAVTQLIEAMAELTSGITG